MGIWKRIKDDPLGQGDRLNSIAVPLVRPSFPEASEDGDVPIDVREMDVIVLTQSCDLLADKAPLVVVAAIHSLDVFEETNESLKPRVNGVKSRRVESRGYIFCMVMVSQKMDANVLL